MKTTEILKVSKKMKSAIDKLMAMFPGHYTFSYEVERYESYSHVRGYYDYCDVDSTESGWQKHFTVSHDGTITDGHACSFVIKRGKMVPA
jgi:phage terminase large subunit-like protein